MKQMTKVGFLGLREEAILVAIEAPLVTGFAILQGGVAIQIKEYGVGPSGVRCRRTVTFDGKHSDYETGRETPLVRLSSVAIVWLRSPHLF